MPFDLLDFWHQEVRLGDGVGGSKGHFVSYEGNGVGSVHAVSPEYLWMGSQHGGKQVNGCIKSRAVRTRPKE